MKKQDKSLGKILLSGLPEGVCRALAPYADVLPEARAAEAEILVCGNSGDCTRPAGLPPATPIVTLFRGRPERLPQIRRRLQQALDEPALHIPDFSLGEYLFSPQERSLQRSDGHEVSLTDRETDMLLYLARRGDRAASREELLRDVWCYQDGVDTHTLETHIYRLRQKLGGGAELLITTEEGYRLRPA